MLTMPVPQRPIPRRAQNNLVAVRPLPKPPAPLHGGVPRRLLDIDIPRCQSLPNNSLAEKVRLEWGDFEQWLAGLGVDEARIVASSGLFTRELESVGAENLPEGDRPGFVRGVRAEWKRRLKQAGLELEHQTLLAPGEQRALRVALGEDLARSRAQSLQLSPTLCTQPVASSWHSRPHLAPSGLGPNTNLRKPISDSPVSAPIPVWGQTLGRTLERPVSAMNSIVVLPKRFPDRSASVVNPVRKETNAKRRRSQEALSASPAEDSQASESGMSKADEKEREPDGGQQERQVVGGDNRGPFEPSMALNNTTRTRMAPVAKVTRSTASGLVLETKGAREAVLVQQFYALSGVSTPVTPLFPASDGVARPYHPQGNSSLDGNASSRQSTTSATSDIKTKDMLSVRLAQLASEIAKMLQNGPVIYKGVFDVVLNGISEERHDEAMDGLQLLLSQMSNKTLLQNLILSSQYREELMGLSTLVGCQDTDEMRSSLREGEADIAITLHNVITNDATKSSIFALKGEEAEGFLILIHTILDRKLFSSDTDGQHRRHCAHKILVKLSVEFGILPSTLNISGITDCDRVPVSGGGFADIFCAVFGGKNVALKRLREYQHQERALVQKKFCKEALLWQALKHPHILPFYGVDLETFAPRLSMVSPWMPRGHILKHIANVGGPKTAKTSRYLYEIAQGLEYLHSQNVIHGDLRGANIFIDDQWRVRLADFGLAEFNDATLPTHSITHAGSIRWMAPELHNGLPRTTASDVYSFACVALEIHTMKSPFSDVLRDCTVTSRVMNGERPLRPDSEMPNDFLWALVEDCWKQNPSDRPEMKVVVEKTIKLSSAYNSR